MAIIKYGPVIADARGSVGGTVFSRNAAGAYMKQRTVPVYPGYDKQIAIAALLSTVISNWKNDLTTAQRNDWNALAAITSLPNKLGEQFSPSGLNLFVRANMLLDLTGQVHVTTPPVAAVIPAPQLTLAWTTLVGIQCTAIGNWDNTATTKVLASWSPNLPLSVNYFKGPWINTWGQTGVYYNALPALMVPSAQLAADSRKFMRFRAVNDDGASSHAALFSADVGAVP